MKSTMISPREASDNYQLRKEYQECLVNFDDEPEKNMLIYDFNGDVKFRIQMRNKDCCELERQLWSAVKYYSQSEDVRYILKSFFVFSDLFIDFLTNLEDVSVIDRLMMQDNFVSFQIPYDIQKSILKELCGSTFALSDGEPAVSDNTKFTCVLVSALQRTVKQIGGIQLGLIPQLEERIKLSSTSRLIEVFSHYALEFHLRFREVTAMNILSANEGAKILDYASRLKKIELLSSYLLAMKEGKGIENLTTVL